jgi:hypothetical protein
MPKLPGYCLIVGSLSENRTAAHSRLQVHGNRGKWISNNIMGSGHDLTWYSISEFGGATTDLNKTAHSYNSKMTGGGGGGGGAK